MIKIALLSNCKARDLIVCLRMTLSACPSSIRSCVSVKPQEEVPARHLEGLVGKGLAAVGALGGCRDQIESWFKQDSILEAGFSKCGRCWKLCTELLYKEVAQITRQRMTCQSQ